MDYEELYTYVKELKDDIKDVKNDIKDVKDDVKDLKEDIKNTYEEVKKTNGRLRKAEGDIIHVQGVLDSREITCGQQLRTLTPVIPTMKFLNWVSNNPKLFLLGFIAVILGLQVLVQEAVQNQWIGQLLNFVKP